MFDLTISEMQLSKKKTGVYIEGIIQPIPNDVLVNGKSLKEILQKFFDEDCKTYWIGDLDSQPEDYAIRFIITILNSKHIHRVFMSQWIGGDMGYEYVMKNNENIYELLSDYAGFYLYLAI